jgi:hypothetical protein
MLKLNSTRLSGSNLKSKINKQIEDLDSPIPLDILDLTNMRMLKVEQTVEGVDIPVTKKKVKNEHINKK